jgi:hypothetical protein
MTYDYPQTEFSKSVMAGAFAGIMATLVNLAFDYFYRQSSQFSPSTIINVSSIIFVTMIIFVLAGFIYFWLNKLSKAGTVIYIALFSALTIYCFYMGLHINRSADPTEIAQFRTLYLGIEIPTGALAAFFVPYLVKHSYIYC